MNSALIIGGTRFIGRYTVSELRHHGYTVTLFNRGRTPNPFEDVSGVHSITGDRRDEEALAAAAESVDPDVVVDCVAYKPDSVRTATELFADVDAYVYISSGAAYANEEVPKREGETPLCECSEEQAVSDAPETYGARKAEGDRAVFEAADRSINAMSIRPTGVYGPHDYKPGRRDYWIDRVQRYDRVVVPGDGTAICHLGYVEDLASAVRILIEQGEPGEAYNFADRRAFTLDELVGYIADRLGTSVETVHASRRELAMADLSPTEFPLYRHIKPNDPRTPLIHADGIPFELTTPYPNVMETAKLARLGWESTPLPEAIGRTVADYVDSARDGREHGPSRSAEERVIAAVTE